jgi:rhamnosyltransferase
MTVCVFAIVVAYNPDLVALSALCALLGQEARVIVVDNSTAENSPEPVSGTEWYTMGRNIGIAAAQNVGICAALSQGAEVLAFFDQDSSPNPKLVTSLVSALGQPPHGISSPVCVDTRSGAEYSPFRFDRWGYARPVPASKHKNELMVDLIISSGLVASAEVFKLVGLMDESLFIDYVDFEWCMRCYRAGIQIKVISSLCMPHTIGSKVIKNGFFTTFVHSPSRNYYRLRNPFLLLRLPHVPRMYAIHEIISAMLHYLLQFKNVKDRGEYLRFGRRALLDGLRGVSGMYAHR